MLRTRILALLLILVAIALAAYDAPQYYNKLADKFHLKHMPQFDYRLGLDLQGGTHLVYQADTSGVPSADINSSMSGLRDVIERRVNLFGVTEPIVQVQTNGSEQRLIVELAGIRDVNEAIKQIGETPFLEFRTELPEAEQKAIAEAQQRGERLNEDPFFTPTPLNGKYLSRAELTFNDTSFEPTVTLHFNDEGSKLFEQITEANVGRRVAIYLDGAPISAPVVREKITGGSAVISGNFTPEEAKQLVNRLNSGALPVPISLISQQTVEASLGQEVLSKGVYAAILGLAAVALFMVFWYRLPGLIAVLALIIYTIITLAVFKAFPVTLTAAGIAGFILSIGMAVDANILIFERIKEELRAGKSLAGAIEEGFSRAWFSIRDSNASSLITCVILYWFGTSLIKGFALTLGLGVLISMFSAITITRTFLRSFRFKDGKIMHMLFGA
jgi:preprotein translocase subunit SecD